MAEVDDLSFESLTFGDDKPNDIRDDDDEKKLSDQFKESEEPEKNVLFISAASYSDKLNSTAVIKLAEIIGDLKAHNFREKQSFGFVQFIDSEAYDKAVEKLSDVEVDGTRIFAEKCPRITPGRDPRTHESNSAFKTATLVLKNLPFQLKQEKLEEMLNTYSTKPLNVSYLYDGTGMFRGMAFVKYKEIEHATQVFEALNNLDISGRKVRVEYKRVMKESENTQDADEKKIQDQLNSFRSNGQINELAFPAGSSYQKKQIRHIAEKLGLGHYTSGEFIVIKKSDSSAASSLSSSYGSRSHHDSHHAGSYKSSGDHSSYKGSNDHHSKPDSYKESSSFGGRSGSVSSGSVPKNSGQAQDIKGRRRGASDAKEMSRNSQHSYEANHMDKYMSQSPGININRGHGNSFSASSPGLGGQYLKSPPNNIPMGSSPTYRNSVLLMNRPNEGIQPIRQPKGPDGTTGFTDDYRAARGKKLDHTQV